MKSQQNNFTRVGQVALHTFHMTQQAAKAAIKIACAGVVLGMIIRLFQYFNFSDAYYGLWFLGCYIKLAVGGYLAITLTFYHLNTQTWKTWRALDFMQQFYQGNSGQHGCNYVHWLRSAVMMECTHCSRCVAVLRHGIFCLYGSKCHENAQKI